MQFIAHYEAVGRCSRELDPCHELDASIKEFIKLPMLVSVALLISTLTWHVMIGQETTMTIRLVKLGSKRVGSEGVRIGTVRRPPRGVPKSEFATQNWYDVWFPNLAPSVATMQLGQQADTPAQWNAFAKKYRAEMARPEASRALDVLAALSHSSNFSVGCYCENEARCHRSVLRELLTEKGAKIE
jgi:uncharacterized protein YeaO (DUF488 family)